MKVGFLESPTIIIQLPVSPFSFQCLHVYFGAFLLAYNHFQFFDLKSVTEPG